MAKTFSIEISDSDYKAFESVQDTPEDWCTNAIQNRIRIAKEKIISEYTPKALSAGVSIPSTEAAIIDDSYARGWTKTAKQKKAEEDADVPE